jgi:ZIP family zinc transporter
VEGEEQPIGAAHTLLLGLIAGATILLGLPVGRIRATSAGLRTALNATAIGVRPPA